MRVLSGVQPSGSLHLGNYYGAVRQFLSFQEEADEALYFIADLHALTTNRNGKLMKQARSRYGSGLARLGPRSTTGDPVSSIGHPGTARPLLDPRHRDASGPARTRPCLMSR